jgi:cyclic pyranopterin phosphate synthase
MPASVVFLPREELLSYEEIARVARVGAGLGIDKIRLTGGEPLLRRDLPRLVEQLVRIPGIRDVGLTTNGMMLAPMAQALWDAGLRRINVSLDTLDAGRFEELVRRPGLNQVLEGIAAAKRVGFDPVKVNAIALRGFTEREVVPLAEYARREGLELRFIEYMPLDAVDQWERGKVLFAGEIQELLEAEFGDLIPDGAGDPQAPAVDFRYGDGRGRVGFIASVSRPFCMSCNRLRLTADGKLRHCLFALEETDVRAIIRNGGDDKAIAGAIRSCVASKWEGHEINTARFIKPARLMHAIGG